MAKKRYGFDLDGVIIDLSEAILERINKQNGTNYTYNDIKKYDMSSIGIENPSWFFKENVDLLFRGKVEPYVRETLDAVLRRGNEVYILTARAQSDMIEAYTKDWLDYKKVPYTELFSHISDKGEACKKLGISFFIDDYPKFVYAVKDRGIEAYLYTRPWNKDEYCLPRVNDWYEIYEKIIGGRSRK